ncbi:MAG TPA: peptidoglycan DD-metalloendopeptidase family protein [Longimicrobiales bacterium]|nr:peptidoglycan DD-metalloendopeptidase family protein [Longimicrobiales bacterium]
MISLRAVRLLTLAFAGTMLTACASGGGPREEREDARLLQVGLPRALPDTTGWGVHVLGLARSVDGTLWAGTFGEGIYVLRRDSTNWENIRAGEGSIAWDYVNSVIPQGRDTIWYGTVGNGFGVSTDSGRTWRNWTYEELGPEWQYVALEGIRTLGDTVFIATADGVRITWDGGNTWRCVIARNGAPGSAAREDRGCTERVAALPNEYVLSIDVGYEGEVRVGTLSGMAISRDGGVTWADAGTAEGVPATRIRGIATNGDSSVWFIDESKVYVDSLEDGEFVEAEVHLPGLAGLPGPPRTVTGSPPPMLPSIATPFGLVAPGDANRFRVYYLAAAERYRPAGDVWAVTWWGPPFWPLGATTVGISRVLAGESPAPAFIDAPSAPAPTASRRPWLRRPIADTGANPYVDQTYRYGSTMGGNFQQHQGVEFNNPAGTPVHAIADGTVAFAGEAEAGANVVAILHDTREGENYVFSTYYHNTELRVGTGARVRAGDVIATVGNTGRATNDHLHLEVHVAPTEDVSAIVDPENRYPPHTVNPQLWIEPVAGTGVVVGRVLNGAGEPVAGARVHGLVVAYPTETPFSFAETYGDRAHADPAYGENFAVGDVPAGSYLLGVTIDGQKVWRRVRVAAGQVTWVEFRP